MIVFIYLDLYVFSLGICEEWASRNKQRQRETRLEYFAEQQICLQVHQLKQTFMVLHRVYDQMYENLRKQTLLT